jgi:hypothetical protein
VTLTAAAVVVIAPLWERAAPRVRQTLMGEGACGIHPSPI